MSKRIKVTCPDGDYLKGRVFIDGEPIDCAAMQVSIGEPYSTVTLTFDAMDVDLDFSNSTTDRDVVAAVRRHEKATGRR